MVPLLALAVVFIFSGCSTSPWNINKDRGVYTIVALSGHNLDMPASGYTSCKTFSPNQTPAAVVVGYGYWDGVNNHPQSFSLNIVEMASGKVIYNFDGQVFAGKAAVYDLPIRKSGAYRLKLIINGSEYDTWDFTVSREAQDNAVTPAAQPAAFAKGNFSASIEGMPDAFNQYDEYLLQAINDGTLKEYLNINHDDFAQLTAGHVVVQFDLSETGQASSPRIIENTLNDTLGKFYLRVLQAGSPYKAWPANVRATFGSSSRSVKITFYLD